MTSQKLDEHPLNDGLKGILPSQRKRGGFLQYNTKSKRYSFSSSTCTFLPPSTPHAPPRLPLKPSLLSLVLFLSSARLAATGGGGGPAACYRHNPSSPSFSLHSRFNLPHLHLSLPTANEVFPLGRKKKQAVGRARVHG